MRIIRDNYYLVNSSGWNELEIVKALYITRTSFRAYEISSYRDQWYNVEEVVREATEADRLLYGVIPP